MSGLQGVHPGVGDQRPQAHPLQTVRRIIQQIIHLISVIALMQKAARSEKPAPNLMGCDQSHQTHPPAHRGHESPDQDAQGQAKPAQSASTGTSHSPPGSSGAAAAQARTSSARIFASEESKYLTGRSLSATAWRIRFHGMFMTADAWGIDQYSALFSSSMLLLMQPPPSPRAHNVRTGARHG